MKKILVCGWLFFCLLGMSAAAQVVFTYENGEVTASEQIENADVRAQEVTLLLAVRPKKGGLPSFTLGTQTIPAGGSAMVTAGPLPYSGSQEDHQISAYLWSGLDQIRPLAPVAKAEQAQQEERYEVTYEGLRVEQAFDPLDPDNLGEWFVSGQTVTTYKGFPAYYSTTVGATAVFRFQVKLTTEYDVYCYVPGVPEDIGSDTAARYTLQHAAASGSGTENATGVLDLKANQGLQKLGSHRFQTGQEYKLVWERGNSNLRACMVILVPKETQQTEKQLGFDGLFASSFAVDGRRLAADADGIYQVKVDSPAGEPILFEIGLEDLMKRKQDNPTGSFAVQCGAGKLTLRFDQLDLDGLPARLGQGAAQIKIKGYVGESAAPKEVTDVLEGKQKIALAAPTVSFQVYAVNGSQKIDLTQGAQGILKVEAEDKVTAASVIQGRLTPLNREVGYIAYGEPQELQVDLKQAGPVCILTANPELEALLDDSTPISKRQFSALLYGAVGLESTETRQEPLSFEEAAVEISALLNRTGRRVVTCLPAEKLLCCFEDAEQIGEEYKDAVFQLAEARLIRGDGSTFLRPKEVLTKKKAAELIYQFVALDRFESPLLSGNWKLDFNDEFNGTQLNSQLWDVSRGVYSTHIASNRFADNVGVEDGYLKLTTKKKLWTYGSATGDWTTGNTWTRPLGKNGENGVDGYQTKYGYFEAMYVYPEGKTGLLNLSFWLMNTGGTKETNTYSEIDINEGRMQNLVQMNYHWSDNFVRYAKGGNYRPPMDLTQKHHVYGLIWTPERLDWYFDGKLIRSYPMVDNPANFDMQVYFSVAVMHLKDGKDDISPSNFDLYDAEFGDQDGKSMNVEYVRVYKSADEPDGL